MASSTIPVHCLTRPATNPDVAMTLTQTPPDGRSPEGDVARRTQCWWLPVGHQPRPTESTTRPEGAGVLWVDVDPTEGAVALGELLGGLGISIPQQLVEDLVEADDQCRLDEYADDVRHVSAVALHTSTRAQDGHGIAFQVVETIVGPDWVVTCWHTSRPELPGQDPGDDRLRETVNDGVRGSWADGDATTAGDVATELVLMITSRYKQSCRALEEWLQDWESAFHADENLETSPLKHLLGLVIEARRRLAALNNARSHATDGHWFGGLSTSAVDDRADDFLDHALKRLQTTFENIRADMELVCMEKMVRQAEVAEESQESDRKFQEALGKITALLLVPTLIAGVFGANTALPGGGTWIGFDGMLALMVVTSVTVYWLLVRRGQGSSTE
jgi:Mg2+ and Co2+ transporter CorA